MCVFGVSPRPNGLVIDAENFKNKLPTNNSYGAPGRKYTCKVYYVELTYNVPYKIFEPIFKP